MTGFALKIIALICMLIDHIGVVFDAPFFFRYIGRIAFPIFAFMVSEGARYTKDIKKYILRLGAFAIISEIPFDFVLAPHRSISLENFYTNTNVFYTLFLGVSAIYVFNALKKLKVQSSLAVACVIPFAFIAQMIQSDYSGMGVFIIFALYIANTKILKIIVLAVGLMIIYGNTAFIALFNMVSQNGIDYHVVYSPSMFIQSVSFYFAASVACVLIALYNNKPGIKLKWLFYWFYPVHLMVLAFIDFFISLK